MEDGYADPPQKFRTRSRRVATASDGPVSIQGRPARVANQDRVSLSYIEKSDLQVLRLALRCPEENQKERTDEIPEQICIAWHTRRHGRGTMVRARSEGTIHFEHTRRPSVALPTSLHG